MDIERPPLPQFLENIITGAVWTLGTLGVLFLALAFFMNRSDSEYAGRTAGLGLIFLGGMFLFLVLF